MNIKNWFKKKDIEVADLDSIELTPEVVVPEPTRRELYDLAVLQVQEMRVKELILRSLKDLGTKTDAYRDTLYAIKYNGGITEVYPHSDQLAFIKENFPNAVLKKDHKSLRLVLPYISIDSIAEVLTKQYLSE